MEFQVIKRFINQYAFSLALIGVTVIATTFFLEVKKPVEEQRDSLSILDEFQVTNNAREYGRGKIEIHYPRSISISDSGVVEMSWIAEGPQYFGDPFNVLNPYNPEEVELSRTVSLYSASFEIVPAEPITSKIKGTKSKAIWSWVILPKKEGNHILLLDLKSFDIDLAQSIGRHWRQITIEKNGVISNESIPEKNIAALEITVLTPEGLPLGVYLFIKYGIMLIGFILMYPAVSKFLSRYLLGINS